jgi:hypothetical protein
MRVPNPSRVRNSEKLSRLLLDLENPEYLVEKKVTTNFKTLLPYFATIQFVGKFL